MASCRFPVVLGVVLISIGHILAFSTVEFASFPGGAFNQKKSGGAKLENKMKELQEKFGTAAKSDKETKEEVVAVKNQMEELTKKFEGSNAEVTETKEQVKEITDRLAKFEANLATAETMKGSVDAVVQTANAHKIDIAELKASEVNMNAKITNLGTNLGNINKEMAETKAELQKGLQRAEGLVKHAAMVSSGEQNTNGLINGLWAGPQEPLQDGGMGVPPPTAPKKYTATAPVEVTASGADGGADPAYGKDCPSSFDFISTTGQCLKVSDPNDKARGMADGSSKCAQFHERGSLAILDSKEKQDGVKTYLSQKGVRHDILVGGSRQGGKYKWVDDEEIGKVGWCRGQPEDRNCVSLWRGQGFCLDDSFCDSKRYLCEVVVGEEYEYET